MPRKTATMGHLLAEVLTPSVLRRIQGHQDTGEVETVRVVHPEAAMPAERDADGRWVEVWVKGLFTEFPVLSRLFSPGGMLWFLPDEGTLGMLLRAGTPGPGGMGARGALVSYLLTGHGGQDGAAPSWLSSSKWGISPPAGKALRMESKDQDVEVDAPADGKVVKIAGSDHPLPKWDTFESALSTFLEQLSTALAAGTSGSPAAQQLVNLAALQAAIEDLRAALGNGSYDSSKARNG